MLSKRSLIFILFWALACGSVSGQESGVLSEPVRPSGHADSNARPESSFRLTGVLVSRSNRSALVNGQVSREGDRVGGAEILAINEGAVRVRMGSRELTVKVGGTVVGERLSNPVARISSEPVRQHPNRRNNTVVGSDPFQAAARSRSGTPVQYGPVQSGETLSGIAQEYLSDGITMNQMMIALFNTNPQAFDGNINVLYEGAMLRIPDGDELHDQAHEPATVQVAQHMDAWRNAHTRQTSLATVASERKYGPVDSGETLSGIAKTVLHDGITVNQMMIGLFHANPQAFGGNVNVLHAGAILRIPNVDELRIPHPETATAEVVRHAQTWQLGDGQHAQSTMAHADMAASL